MHTSPLNLQHGAFSKAIVSKTLFAKTSLAMAIYAIAFTAGKTAAQDCNHNGVDDNVDISNGTSQDCNEDAVPDECGLYPATSITLAETAKLTAGDAQPDDRYGAAVALNPQTAFVGAPYHACIDGPRCGAVYVSRRDPNDWEYAATITPPTRRAGDRFGEALDADGDWLAVGSPYVHVNLTGDCGAVEMFQKDGDNWVHRQTIHANTPTTDAQFGSTVAISGNILVVGEPNAPCDAGSSCGRVYTYQFNGTTWEPQDDWYAPTLAFGDTFGTDVDIHGNVIVVGAPLEDCGTTIDCGAAHVYEFGDQGWAHAERLTEPTPTLVHRFATSVAVHGDVVSASTYRSDCEAGADCGEVSVFRRTPGGWNYDTSLSSPEPAPFEQFGFSLAMDDDIIIAGARWADAVQGQNSGAVYTYRYANDSWQLAGHLAAKQAATAAWTGYAVDIDAGNVIAGAQGDRANTVDDAGAAYLFTLRWPDCNCNGMADISEIQLGAEDCDRNNVLDACQVVEFDCNGNGIVDACDTDCDVNGIPDDCDSFADCNANGIPDPCDDDCNANGLPDDCDTAEDCNGDGRPDTCRVPFTCHAYDVQKITPADGKEEDEFGNDLDLRGTRMVVGANRRDCDSGVSCGAVTIYSNNGPRWLLDQTITPGVPYDQFGYSVRISADDEIIVGSPGDGSGGGAVVYRLDEEGWSRHDTLRPDFEEDDSDFGVSLDVHRDTLIVGASDYPCYDADEDAEQPCGAAFVFRRDGRDWEFARRLLADDLQGGDRFGRVTAIHGRTAVVASPDHRDPGASWDGKAYVFRNHYHDWHEVATLPLPAPRADGTPHPIAIHGNRIAIGAAADSEPGIDRAGAVYVYREVGHTWTLEQRIVLDDAQPLDLFGAMLDLDGDTILAGAPGRDCPDAVDCGRAFVFRYNGATWQRTAELHLRAPDYPDGFAAGAGAIDSGRAAIGAALADGNQADTGAVYAFHTDDCNCNAVADICDNGDYGNDGARGLDDWQYLLNCASGPDDAASACCLFYDLNSDFFVDLADAAIFARIFGD